jgi:predicted anti-sigma-YlaC factor YlaD
MQVVPNLICDRVRSQVSLELDGELSELERLMVARHLERCADCRSFRDRAAEIVHEMRSAPFERFERRVVLPRIHRGRLRVARDVTVRASAMAAGLLMVLGLGLGERGVLDSGQTKQTRARHRHRPGEANLHYERL